MLRCRCRANWNSVKTKCLWCNFPKSAFQQYRSEIQTLQLRVRLLTGFPSAWLPNVTRAPRIPVSSSPQLQILENNPLPTPAPPLPPPSPFSDRTGQSWTKTFHQQGSCIHPDSTGVESPPKKKPRYVTGFWSILACLQKEFTCRGVCWKCGKVAGELMDFSPLEQSEAKNPNNIRLRRPQLPRLAEARPAFQIQPAIFHYFNIYHFFYYRPNLDANKSQYYVVKAKQKWSWGSGLCRLPAA